MLKTFKHFGVNKFYFLLITLWDEIAVNRTFLLRIRKIKMSNPTKVKQITWNLPGKKVSLYYDGRQGTKGKGVSIMLFAPKS